MEAQDSSFPPASDRLEAEFQERREWTEHPTARAVIQQLVAALERHTAAGVKDCVMFGPHELCGLRNRKCTYRQSEDALTVASIWLDEHPEEE